MRGSRAHERAKNEKLRPWGMGLEGCTGPRKRTENKKVSPWSRERSWQWPTERAKTKIEVPGVSEVSVHGPREGLKTKIEIRGSWKGGLQMAHGTSKNEKCKSRGHGVEVGTDPGRGTENKK